MEVNKEHFVDCSHPNQDGTFDYYCAYNLFRFHDHDFVIVARAYDDEAERAHFLRKEQDHEFSMMNREDTLTDLFRKACEHLRNVEGKKELALFINGAYEPIPDC